MAPEPTPLYGLGSVMACSMPLLDGQKMPGTLIRVRSAPAVGMGLTVGADQFCRTEEFRNGGSISHHSTMDVAHPGQQRLFAAPVRLHARSALGR